MLRNCGHKLMQLAFERGAAIAIIVSGTLASGTLQAFQQRMEPNLRGATISPNYDEPWIEPAGYQDTTQNQSPTTTQQPNTPRRPVAPSNQFATNSANRTLGGAGGPGPKSTYMMGDFFFSNGQLFVPNPQGIGKDIIIGELPGSGGSRRVKISENNSPIPRDRVFFNYNHFHNAIRVRSNTPYDMNVDRYTPGFEKTFWDGMASVELRTPIAISQNPDLNLLSVGPDRETMFGNMTVATKLLLWQDDLDAVAVGMGINLPTGPDTRILQANNQPPALTIFNESVHLMPYIGVLRTPTDRTFIHAYVQVDVDANGNGVFDQFGNKGGDLNDQTLFYADLAMGYWMYRAPEAYLVTGIAPTIEFHYTTSLNDADILTGGVLGPFGMGNTFNRVDVANATLATQFYFGSRNILTVGAVLPLSQTESERQFDAEVVFQFNRFY